MAAKSDFRSKRFHIIIDAFDCEPKFLADEQFLMNFEKDIAQLLGMSILKGPIAAQGIPENPGLSVFSIIDFSHISIHTFTASNELYLDIFSCKPFDYGKLEKYIKETLHLRDEQFFKTIVHYDK
jgi:S-adenosylmethionine decarboxylase